MAEPSSVVAKIFAMSHVDLFRLLSSDSTVRISISSEVSSHWPVFLPAPLSSLWRTLGLWGPYAGGPVQELEDLEESRETMSRGE